MSREEEPAEDMDGMFADLEALIPAVVGDLPSDLPPLDGLDFSDWSFPHEPSDEELDAAARKGARARSAKTCSQTHQVVIDPVEPIRIDTDEFIDP